MQRRNRSQFKSCDRSVRRAVPDDVARSPFPATDQLIVGEEGCSLQKMASPARKCDDAHAGKEADDEDGCKEPDDSAGKENLVNTAPDDMLGFPTVAFTVAAGRERSRPVPSVVADSQHGAPSRLSHGSG